MKNPLLDLLHDTSHDIGIIQRHVEFVKEHPERLEKSLEQIKTSAKNLQNRLDEYYNLMKK
jgi:hypothetical protein